MLMTLLQTNYMALFNWVLTTSAKASIFIVFLLGVKYVLRHRMGARFQYMLWSVLMIGLVSPWTPSSPVSVNNLVNSSYIQQVLAPISNRTTQPTLNVIDTKQLGPQQTAIVDNNSNKATSGTETPLTSSNKVAPFAIFPFIYKLMFLIWLLGILIFSVLTILVNIRFYNKIEHNLVTNPSLLAVYNQLKVKLKIKAEIQLIKTRHVNSPSLLGFIHPRLLLPIGIEQTFSLEQISHIFLHELLHFKRKDIMINWLIQVLVIVHWFNPLIWYAFHRMREDQEIACDALAMDRIDTRQSNDYAYTLIKLVETYSNAPRLASMASLSGSKSQIKRRLTMIKNFKPGSVKWSVLGFLVIVLIASAVFTRVNTDTSNVSPKGDEVSKALSQAPEPTTEVKNMSLRVAEIYKVTNPQIVKVKSTQVEVTKEPMYIVNLTGEFQKGNLKATNLSFSVLADGTKVWALRAFDNNNKDIWQEAQIDLTTGIYTTKLMVKYLKDHGYSISNVTGGGNLAGAKIQLPNSFNAVINNVKIGELLREKNELSKRNELDFSKYLGQKASIFTWGLDATANFPKGSDAFFIIYDDNIVGVWFESSIVNGESNKTLGIFEGI